jgi:DnaJ-class molecular chaperone
MKNKDKRALAEIKSRGYKNPKKVLKMLKGAGLKTRDKIVCNACNGFGAFDLKVCNICFGHGFVIIDNTVEPMSDRDANYFKDKDSTY